MPVSRKRKRPKPKAKRKAKEPKWESFERVVAAIHMAEMQGATVEWNEIIEGRQFDVTIRFKVGFYEYLTLIECRDYSRPIEVGQVEAFATKSRNHKASKAVMVSTNGFQNGAREVARKENIELYSLRQINKLSEESLADVFLSFVVVQPVAFRMNGKVVLVFPPDPKACQHQLQNIRLTNYGDNKLTDLLRPFAQLVHPTPLPNVPDVDKLGFPFKRATPSPQTSGFQLSENTRLILPDTKEEIPVSEFLFVYFSRTMRLVNIGGVDPSVFADYGTQYEYKNELNEEITLIDPATLQMGINTVFEVGKFYRQPQLKEFIYYCEKVSDSSATMLLLRSHQHGKLVRMQVEEPLAASKGYVEIEDESEVAEAKGLLEDFLIYRQKTVPTAEGDALIWIA
jgi:hypothetical protein